MEWSMPSDSGYLLKSLTFSSPFSSKSRQGTCGFRESQATHLPPGITSKRCSSRVSSLPSQRFSGGVIIFSQRLVNEVESVTQGQLQQQEKSCYKICWLQEIEKLHAMGQVWLLESCWHVFSNPALQRSAKVCFVGLAFVHPKKTMLISELQRMCSQ